MLQGLLTLPLQAHPNTDVDIPKNNLNQGLDYLCSLGYITYMATIYDIAQNLGTTHVTVSRALRNDPRVAAKTRDRVLKAAAQMNYRPQHTRPRAKRRTHPGHRTALGFGGRTV